MQKDYYSLLGVGRAASADEIKLAYRKLAQRLHPDVSANPRDEDRFKEITVAYQVLRDAERRVRYDIEAMEAELDASERELNSAAEMMANGYAASVPPAQPGPGARSRHGPGAPPQQGPGTSWERDFGDHEEPPAEKEPGLLKRFARRHAKKADAGGYPIPGDDYEVVAEITFEEAVRGGNVTLTFTVPGRAGNGHSRETEHTVEIRIPKNAFPGQRLRIKGKGGAGAYGGPTGDLHVEIAFKRHKQYRVRGLDVWFYLPIAPWEAVLGAVVEIPTLEGKPFKVHVPAGATSGQTFRLPARGLPKPDGHRGDLLACLRVLTPEHPSDAEKQLYLQLARQSRFNARRGFG